MKRVHLNYWLVLAVLTLATAGCKTPCIQPTVAKATGDYDKQLKLSANLQQLKASGELSTDFKKKVETDYVQLSDKHQGIELLLKAAECYKKEGWSVDQIQQFFSAVILPLMRENAPVGQKGGGPTLTDADRDYISKGANAAAIFRRLDALRLNK